MSDLEELCETLSAVDHDIVSMAQALHHHAQVCSRGAQYAASAVRNEDGTTNHAASHAASALSAAARSVGQAAALLNQAALQGQGFVARTVGGSGHGSSAGTSPMWAGSRYLQPPVEQQAKFARVVAAAGAGNPEGWIAYGNPKYTDGEVAWTNNCGPCSRSFADTFQGVSAFAAYGDGKRPPGELAEMWEAVGVRPTACLSNVGRPVDPAAFTAGAFRSLEDQLRAQGPGAAAIVGVDWDHQGVPQGTMGGHWFNAYVDAAGEVRWADEQIARVGRWPPEYATPIWKLEAVARSSGRAPWKEVSL